MAKRFSAWAPLAAALVVCVTCWPGSVQGADYGMAAEAADEIDVRTARAADGETTEVVVALVLAIRPDVVWAVLNDFENMPRFVPDIRATRLISEAAGRKRVEIDGVGRALFMAFPIHTTLDVVYPRDGAIAIDSVAGNLSLHAVVQMQGDGPVTRVDYQARIVPDFWLPPLIGDYLIGRLIGRQFEGMVAEMHRRAEGRRADQGARRP